ncbi:leucine-rich repeat domain-containing protein [Segatella copri]|uniref:leucine-rich repeat domain-containing protein n=3 Tax=Segatella copri TaxID=165179 RepID=UPI0018852653|nr:leucine-rich repeat domain-containing protein [Segatella copri]
MDEFGVKYSKDGRKLLKAPQNLDSTYSIKEGTKIICDMAFADCKSLRSLVVPDGVTSIGKRAFSDCTSLSSLVLPESVGNIIGNPFSGWDGELKCLSPYFIYDNKVLFDKDKSKIIAFRDKKTTSYVIPDYVTSIGNGAFYDCKSLRNIVIPDSVTSIGDSAFSGCESLGSLVIPEGVTSIGDSAFRGCGSLSSLVLPESVGNIIGNPFSGWDGELKCLSPYFIVSGSAFIPCPLS